MKRRAAHRRRYSLLFYSFFLFPLLLISVFIFSIRVNGAVRENASTDEIIVKYKLNVSDAEKGRVRQELQTTLKEKIGRLRAEVVKVPPGKVDEFVQKHKRHALVEYAEPNYLATKLGVTNDSSLPQQWGLFKINAANSTTQSAWDVTTSGATVKIAILDTGIEATHPDLSGKVVGSANFTTSPTVSDVDGHGTHTAGIAAAATNNGSGVAGTGYNTTLLNGKVLDDTGSGAYSWVINGIIWASDQGAQVISMSLGGTGSSLALQDAVNYAWSKGVVVVAAAGNNGNSNPHYPAYYTNVIAVAATDGNDAKASFSTYGSWVDVAAPGINIYSTYKGNGYISMSGTSMAAPFAAGTAALIFAKGDCSTNTCVRGQLEKTADMITGTGTYWTWGRINTYKAVMTQSETITPTPTQSEPTPTATPTPIQSGPTPTVTPTPTPTVVAQTMTVSDIAMSYTVQANSWRRVNTTITVRNETTNALLPSATVNASITTPSGDTNNYSGRTNSAGKITFTLRTKEKGTFTTTVTNVTKSLYSYHPTLSTKSLLVQ